MSGALLRGTEGVRRAGTPTVNAGSFGHQQPLAPHSSIVGPSLQVSPNQPSSNLKVDIEDARFAQATLSVNRPRSRSDILPTLEPTKPIIRAARSASNTAALTPRPRHSLVNSTASSLADTTLQEHLVNTEPRSGIADVFAVQTNSVSPPLHEHLGNSLAFQDLPTPVRPVVSRLTQQTLRRRTESTPQDVGTRQWTKYNIKRRETSAIQQVPRWLSDAEPLDPSGEEVASPQTSLSTQSHPSVSSPPRSVDFDTSGSHSNSDSSHSLSKPCDMSSSCMQGSTRFESSRHTRLDFGALSTGPSPLPSILQGQPLVLDTYSTESCQQYSKELGVIQSAHSTPRRRALTLATDQPSAGGHKPSPLRNRGQKHNDSPLRLDTETCSLDFVPWEHTSPLTTSGTPHQDYLEGREPRSEDNIAITASALQYHRKSPTRASIHEFDTSLPCELCGSLVLRWAILLPCGHRACTACCCSGVNQVSTTPPRPHTCAACQICVTGIALSIPAAQAAQAAAHHADTRYEPSVAATFVDRTARHRFDTSFGGHAASDANIPGIQTSTSMYPILDNAIGNEWRVQDGLHGHKYVNDNGNGAGMHSHNQTRRQQRQVSPEMTFMTDESMVLSEDASFYRPQHVTRLQINQHDTAADPSKNASHSQSSISTGETRLSALAAPYTHHAVSCDTLEEPCVIRMDNIPWTTSYNDVLSWLPDPATTLPDREVVPQPVHIPLDLKTGKTANSGFIEVRDADSAKKIIRKRNNTQLMGRPVSLLLSNYDALAVEIFPSYTGWESPARYITEQQLAQLVHIIQNGAPQLKDAMKPIELLVSILQLIPADFSTEEGDLLFEYTFEAVHLISTRVAHSTSASPIQHQREQVVNVFERLLRACLNCAAFSTEHKSYLQQHAAAISQLPFITMLSQPKPPAAMESRQVHDLHYRANPPLDLLSPQDQQALAPLHPHAIDSIAQPSPAVPFLPLQPFAATDANQWEHLVPPFAELASYQDWPYPAPLMPPYPTHEFGPEIAIHQTLHGGHDSGDCAAVDAGVPARGAHKSDMTAASAVFTPSYAATSATLGLPPPPQPIQQYRGAPVCH